jgi:hypothetical protein
VGHNKVIKLSDAPKRVKFFAGFSGLSVDQSVHRSAGLDEYIVKLGLTPCWIRIRGELGTMTPLSTMDGISTGEHA